MRHLLGTDQLGRDLLSRLLFGARISLVVGLAATTLNVVVATVIGGTSGFLGGKLDLAVQRFVDAWMAFPGLLLLLTIMSIAGRGLPQIIVVLGIAGGVGGSRVVRGAVVATKENDYFLAAKALGAPTTQILVRHVLPNIVAPLIIVFSINVGGVILAEASLSFLGFGLPSKVPSWGGMLSREGRRFMEQAPWLALWPGLCLTIVVYSFNMLGDAMRDLLDPRLRGGGGQSRRWRRHLAPQNRRPGAPLLAHPVRKPRSLSQSDRLLCPQARSETRCRARRRRRNSSSGEPSDARFTPVGVGSTTCACRQLILTTRAMVLRHKTMPCIQLSVHYRGGGGNRTRVLKGAPTASTGLAGCCCTWRRLCDPAHGRRCSPLFVFPTTPAGRRGGEF